MLNTESFVFYESVYKIIQRLKTKFGKEFAFDFLIAIIEHGLYGVVPDDDSDFWLYGFEQIITSIESAKDRHKSAIDNGAKGGRPYIELNENEVYELYEELGTWKAVAKYLGIDEDTLRNRRKVWEYMKENEM